MPCAHCKQIGHNKRTCAFISKEMVAEEVKEEMTLREKPLFLPTGMDGSSHPLMNWVIDETDEEEDEKGEEEETDEEEVRKEEELYRKYGYDNEGTKLEKKKKAAPKKNKKAAPKKKKKGMKGAVELIMNQQKKAKKRKVVDIDTIGLKVDRSIADLLARNGRMIDPEYIKEVVVGDE